MKNLGMLDAWKSGSMFRAKSSAQSYFGTNQPVMAVSGSACGAGDDGKSGPKPSACGAGDK